MIERIFRWIEPIPGDLFIEIGAGDGALSTAIARAASGLLAVEIDEDCIDPLKSALMPYPSAKVIPGDILHLDIPRLVEQFGKPCFRLRITGNLPYNIATAVIERLLRLRLPVHDLTFLVQLEVAQRIVASPSTAEYGYFSIFCQHHADVRKGFAVSSACFVPRPNVSSAMVSLRPKKLQWDDSFEESFELICKAAFSHRRKTLANSLSKHPALNNLYPRLLEQTGIQGKRRAEELTIAEYERLARAYLALQDPGSS